MMDNKSLVRNSRLILGESVKLDERVLRAMEQVDRREFLPDLPLTKNDLKEYLYYYSCWIDEAEMQRLGNSNRRISVRDLAYFNIPLDIGYGQYCSQPSIVGFMNQLMEIEEGMEVLEIGTGCGYHTAITSHILGEEGFLTSIEINPNLTYLARENIARHFGFEAAKRIRIITGDGSRGFDGCFDRIYFTTAVDLERFDTERIARQLKFRNGIFLFPEKSGCLIRQRYQDRELIEEERYGNGRIKFVPLQVKGN